MFARKRKHDPAKLRKAIAIYVELHGMKLGDNQYSVGQNVPPKTQQEIADEF
jgi:hypothetical protein